MRRKHVAGNEKKTWNFAGALLERTDFEKRLKL